MATYRRSGKAALERLETAEERAHARLEAALQRGDPVQVQTCQDFWLKCSETLVRSSPILIPPTVAKPPDQAQVSP